MSTAAVAVITKKNSSITNLIVNKMKKSYTQVTEEITKLTMKHGKEFMDKTMYRLFKKRRFELLDARQAEKLLEEMKKGESHGNGISRL
jgi:hypothetical protein